MKSSESIDAVVAKYQRLLARFHDLEQQTTEKQDKWAEIEKQFKVNESLTRELCELILAKDPKEMQLGTEYSWNKLKTRDIIQRSKNVFNNYNESRTALLRDIQRQSEERRVMIESLQSQTERDANTIQQLRDLHKGDVEDERAESSENTDDINDDKKPIDDKTMARVPYSTQKAAKQGNINVVQYDGDDYIDSKSPPEGRPSVSDEDIRRGQNATDMKIWGDDNDLSKADIEQQAAMAERSVTANIQRSAGNITSSSKKANAAAAAKSTAKKQFVSIDTNEITEKIKEHQWVLLDIIGSTGMCEGSEIIDEALAKNPEEKNTVSGFRYLLMGLVYLGCLLADSVDHPLKPRFSAYYLSDVGRSIYADHFGKQPVTSERDILIAEHDNLEHGFGIKSLKNILETNSFYSNVSMSRMENTFKLRDGTSYIPDIVAQGRNRKGQTFRIYMEYERGTHHQVDFNIKLNKAMKITSRLDIVCPNNSVADNLKDKVAAWVESRGGAKALPKVKVRITTLRRIINVTNINDDTNWIYAFNLSDGDTPIERKN